jgi:hypothetical protein
LRQDIKPRAAATTNNKQQTIIGMIHIVFDEQDKLALQAALEMDESLAGEIIVVQDDWSVGPVNDIYKASGIEMRKEWWSQVSAGGDFENEMTFQDEATMEALIHRMQEQPEEQIWIWAAQNSHDVCGYYWLLPFMREYQGRVHILYLNNLPFINEKGNIFYPVQLNEIQPKEFLKAKKLARPITLSEFEVDPDEWTKLCNDNKGIRILEGGKKLIQFDYDHFDAEIKKYIMPEWQKASKIVNNFLSKSKVKTSEVFALWRLKTLVAMDLYEVQGKIEKMKDFEIKYKSKSIESEA